MTLLIGHPSFLEHDTGDFHPERADRLRAVTAALADEEFAGLTRLVAPAATIEQLTRVHPRNYVDAILGIRPPEGELVHVDGDTVMSAGSANAARHAARRRNCGSGRGAEWVYPHRLCRGCARPDITRHPTCPAVSACSTTSRSARWHARAAYGLRRVALIDFDVHHGQGTQAVVEPDPDLFYASTHQYPLYPGTGSARERGVAGNVVNVPLAAGSGSAAFRAAWVDRLLPALDDFTPELVIVSAGFDAHRRDPLAQLDVETEDFVWLTEELLAIADRHARGRLVSVLEGGYDLAALAESVSAHVRALMRA